MKIVHLCLCGLYYEGYAYHENLLPKYHKKLGHDVTIIAPVYSSFKKNGEGVNEELPGVKILESGIKLIRKKPFIKSYKINSHLHLFESIKQDLIDEKPDLIFGHGLGTFDNLVLLSIKKYFPNVKIAIDNHADLINSCKSIFSKLLYKCIYRYLLTPLLDSIVDIYYGVTPSRCDFLRDIYGVPTHKIKLSIMGADDEFMKLDDRYKIRDEIRKKYGVKDSDFLLVTGGKLDKIKRIDDLISAVNQIKDDRLKLLLFGSVADDIKEYVEKSLSDKIIYVGWVNSHEVYNYFYASDLTIFTGLHSVLWEQAVASRVPCVFSKINGFEHINFNDNCLFFDDSTIECYKATIESILKNKEKHQQLKRHADSDGAIEFNYSYIANKILKELKLI